MILDDNDGNMIIGCEKADKIAKNIHRTITENKVASSRSSREGVCMYSFFQALAKSFILAMVC
jgi:pyruvate/oxaloacetate carboxyltransferase